MNDKSAHVVRGGCWYNDPQYARVAYRHDYSPGNRYNDLGIRLVEVIDDPAPAPFLQRDPTASFGAAAATFSRTTHRSSPAATTSRTAAAGATLASGSRKSSMIEYSPGRVSRGGGWIAGPHYAGVARGGCDAPGSRYGDVGIRLVEVVEDSVPAPAATTSRSAPAAATSAPGSWKSSVIKDSPGRVSRGGGWISDPHYSRVARGGCDAPGSRYSDVGIRLVEVTDD